MSSNLHTSPREAVASVPTATALAAPASTLQPLAPVAGSAIATAPPTLRIIQIALVAATAFFLTLVVFNNLTDYDSNYQFVRHVLSMSDTFPGNRGMWRAINTPAIHHLFYWTIIAWEGATMILCWVGALRCLRAVRKPASEFEAAKHIAFLGLGLSLLQWFVAFLTVGGEWFLMWQSKTWNGQEAAMRMFLVIGVVLLLLAQRDAYECPAK